MLDLEPTDWNSKMLEQRNTQLANQEKQKNEEDKKQIKGTMPSHELAAYVGTFNHPAYGKAEIALDYDKLALKFHGLHMPLNHYHYDVFQTDDPDLGKNKIQFHFDIDGNVSSLSTALEPAVDDIIFEKVPDTIALAVEKLEAFLGEYEISGMQIKVWKKGENTLMMTVPGQPDYTLSAEKENHFFIEGLKGYKVSFEWVDDKVKAIILDQPNGVFTAQRVN